MPSQGFEAEAIRTSILSLSGRLNTKQFGPAVSVMADNAGRFVIGKENLNAGRPGAVIPMEGEEFRRSIYIQVRRSRPLDVLRTFDSPRMEPNCISRSSSTVAQQALLLMNGPLQTEFAKHFADRIQEEGGEGLEDQVRHAWLLTYSRQPSAEELKSSVAFITQQKSIFESKPLPEPKKGEPPAVSPQQEAMASFCHALLSSNEFLYVN